MEFQLMFWGFVLAMNCKRRANRGGMKDIADSCIEVADDFDLLY